MLHSSAPRRLSTSSSARSHAPVLPRTAVMSAKVNKKRLKRIQNEYKQCAETDRTDGVAVSLAEELPPGRDDPDACVVVA